MKRIFLEMDKRRIRLGWLCSLLLLCGLPVWGEELTLYIDEGMIVIEAGQYTQGENTYNHTGSYVIKQKTPETPTSNSIIVKGGTHDITLDGVNIEKANDAGETHSAFEIKRESGAVVNLTLKRENVLTASASLKASFSRSGIFVPTGTTLTITSGSTGKLIARGKLYKDSQNTQIASAGIGGSDNWNWGIKAGTININGGIIDAYGAGTYDIGVGGTVNITGGVVRFGNGEIEEHVTKNNCIIFIKDMGMPIGNFVLTQNLELSENLLLIIPPDMTLTNNRTITNYGMIHNHGTISGSGSIVNEGKIVPGSCSVSITGGGEHKLSLNISGGTFGTDYKYDLHSDSHVLKILSTKTLTISDSDMRIPILVDVDGATIQLNNVKIDISSGSYNAINVEKNTTLILEDGTTNSLLAGKASAGIHVAEEAQLIMQGNASLEVQGGFYGGAAIGANWRERRTGIIEIKSGKIVARSMGEEAVIGATLDYSHGTDEYCTCKKINISGGELTLVKERAEGASAVKASALEITGGIFRLDEANSSTLNKDGDRICIVFVENEGTVYGNYTLQQDLELKEEQSLNIPGETSLIIPEAFNLTGAGWIKGNIPTGWDGLVEVTLYNETNELETKKMKTGDELPPLEDYLDEEKDNHKCIGWSLDNGGELAEKYTVRYEKEPNNLYLKWEPKKKLTADDFVFKKPEDLVYKYYFQEIDPPVSLIEQEGVGPVSCEYEYYKEEEKEWEGWSSSNIYDAGTYRVLVSMDESEDYQSMNKELVSDEWQFTVAPKDIKVTPDAEQVFFEGGKEAAITYTVEDNVRCEGTLALKPKEDGEGYQYDMGSLKVDYWNERNYKLNLEDVEVTVYECSPNEVEATIVSDNVTEYGWAKEAIILSAPKGFVFADDGNESKQFEVEGSYSLKLKKGDGVTTYEHQLPIDKNDPVIKEVTTNNLSFTIKVMDELSGIAEVKLGDMALKQTAEGVYSGTANAGSYIIKVTDKAGNFVERSVTLEAKEFDITLEEVSGGKIYAKSKAVAGETVTLRCEEHTNYDFVRWEVKETESGAEVDVADNSFEMPAAAVTVSAVFRYDPPYVPPTYYDVYFEANDSVLLSSDQETVLAGHSLTFTADAAEGYDPTTLVVEYRPGRNGSWRTLTPNSAGEYRIANVGNDIYICARIERLEDPTANEQVDTATSRVWATGSRLCITLTEPQKLHLVSMEGRLLRTEQLPVGYSEITGLPAGVHIVLLSDGLRKKVVIR